MSDEKQYPVTIESDGTSVGTVISVGGKQLHGVLSVDIDEMDADTGAITATLVVAGIRLGNSNGDE